MRILTAILSLSLGANAALAQGTYHFEWHGSQNQIHGGFDITYQEMHSSGIRWGSQVLLDSLFHRFLERRNEHQG